ncbi:MAG: metallophosphoesterase family protein [Kiritimatiellae bacterium]|nr:metallophosphoesterase family protein [Kiritimatiellia bacterium]
MRYAIVSDLHANAPAWQNVLNDLAGRGVDRIVCLGDVVGYGPDPVEVLESVYRHVHVTLMGNHDAAVAGIFDPSVFTDRAQAAVVYHRERLSANALAWLRRLPYLHAEGGFHCAHGDFTHPKSFRYLIGEEAALASFRAVSEQLLFVGHTHLAGIHVIGTSGVPHILTPGDFELEAGKRYIVNPGSVGYPRTGDCRTSYCIYDDQKRSVCFHQLPFDLDGYHAKMQAIGIADDPWVEEKANERRLETVRESVSFGNAVPEEETASPRRKPVSRWILWCGCLAVLAVLAVSGLFFFRAGKAAVEPDPAIRVPAASPAGIALYPLKPQDKNWLSPWPPALGPGEPLDGWTYSFENRERQHFSTGLRDAATTLKVRNEQHLRVCVETPLFDLSGTGVKAVRMRGYARTGNPFSGNVQFRLAFFAANTDGTPVPMRSKSFELNPSRRKGEADVLSLNRKIPLPQHTVFVQFSIDGMFEGSLELALPYVGAETVSTN